MWSKLSFSLPVFKLISTLVEQKSSKGTRLFRNSGIKVRRFFIKPFAQLCIHRRVFRFIESFFKYLKRNKLLLYYLPQCYVWKFKSSFEIEAILLLTSKITPFKIVVESRPTLNISATNFSNFSGVNLLRMPLIWN